MSGVAIHVALQYRCLNRRVCVAAEIISQLNSRSSLDSNRIGIEPGVSLHQSPHRKLQITLILFRPLISAMFPGILFLFRTLIRCCNFICLFFWGFFSHIF